MSIPIILASDENYVPYMATTMQSVMENANKEQKYVFIILYKNLGEEILEKLKNQVASYIHFSIKFINVSKEFENFSMNMGNLGSWTVETYFRLIAPWLLKEFDKIIYMDCDIVCNSDISYVYNIEIGSNLIAGVPDIPQISIFNNPKYKGDFKSSIIEKLDNPNNYINAGFIIMNLKEFRNKFTLDYLLNLAQNAGYKFHDQDLLNFIGKNSIFILPPEFNFLNTDWDISHAPKKLIEEYCKAKENPKIIHYTTSKPWKQELNPLYFHIFWKYSTRTPFIDSIVKNMVENKLIGQKPKRVREIFMTALKRKLLAL
jgi:lipopolysaccharide biosynthesis glycosyltransferase